MAAISHAVLVRDNMVKIFLVALWYLCISSPLHPPPHTHSRLTWLNFLTCNLPKQNWQRREVENSFSKTILLF